MNNQTLIIVGGIGLYLLLTRKGQAATANNGDAIKPGTETAFERPSWGANWISNQWAMVMQGQLASTGQIQAGWKL